MLLYSSPLLYDYNFVRSYALLFRNTKIICQLSIKLPLKLESN